MYASPSAPPAEAGSETPVTAMSGSIVTTANTACTAVAVIGGVTSRREMSEYTVHASTDAITSRSPTPKPCSTSSARSPPVSTTVTPTKATTRPSTCTRFRRSCRKIAAASAMVAGLMALMTAALTAPVRPSAA